jgi:putative membrane protein
MTIKTIALIAALAMPVAAMADNPPGQTPQTPKTTDKSTTKEKLGDVDLAALAHFHHVNQMEIDMGKLAQKQSSNPAVKEYGQMLVNDHQAADKELTGFAKKQSVTIPMDKPKDDAEQKAQQDMKDMAAHLRTLKGKDFDTAFLQMMVQGHEMQLTKIDIAIGAVQNPDLVTILRDIKPVLQKHEDKARELQTNPPQAMQ